MSQSKSSPNTYVVVSSCPINDKQYDCRFLGVFTDPAAIGPYLTANSSGNQPFAGEGDVSSLGVGESKHTPFGAVIICVTALRTDGRTKTIYVSRTDDVFKVGRAYTSKPKDKEVTFLTLKCCPICMEWAEPADDDGHCSYECASGG